MKKSWGFYDNGQYKVGSNGTTMYLYDAESHELAKFKDIPYAYNGAFKPGSNIFVLRSTEGRLAVYDCDEQKLVCKFRFSKVDGAQDDGFCFSPDSRYFFNVERFPTDLCTRLSIYETQSFKPVKRLFEGEISLVLNHIEYNPVQKQYHVLYFTRDNQGLYRQGHIGALIDDQLVPLHSISQKSYDFLRSYKSLQRFGFTERAMEWSGLRYAGCTKDEMETFRDMDLDLFSFPQRADQIIKYFSGRG